MQKLAYKLSELAQLLEVELRGDPNVEINGLATLQHARTGQLSFLHNSKYKSFLAETQASAVILSSNDAQACTVNALITDNPYLSYAKAVGLFAKIPAPKPGIHATAVIGEGCQIDSTASIGPQVVIGDHVTIGAHTIIGAGCSIGDHCHIDKNTRLWDRVTIYYGVKIGQRVIIHSGAVIGSDGFGLAPDKGKWVKIPQIGSVHIHNDVEIGANTSIDRGALEDTVIEEGVKLDNQIQVGHNVRIGAHTAIAGCVGIAGSTTIGKHCMIGGGAGIIGHLTITDGVMITAGTGVAKSITEPGVYSSGIDAQAAKLWRKNMFRIYHLDEQARKIQELDKLVHRLKEQLEKETTK